MKEGVPLVWVRIEPNQIHFFGQGRKQNYLDNIEEVFQFDYVASVKPGGKGPIHWGPEINKYTINTLSTLNLSTFSGLFL